MARGGLNPEKLRELARAGAEAVLKQLRAEIIAIERTFPELAFAETTASASSVHTTGWQSDTSHVGCGAQGSL